MPECGSVDLGRQGEGKEPLRVARPRRAGADWKYRVSGHESFPCRYNWLPKVVRGLRHDPYLFADDQAMVVL